VVLRDVADYAIVVGNPAVQNGWMSPHGCRLEFSGGRGLCPESGEEFELVKDSSGSEIVKAG
jgi:UDP-2-acetamido-3-amino-2,3-dideoxy-glucuronate N-acetyltransferase